MNWYAIFTVFFFVGLSTYTQANDQSLLIRHLEKLSSEKFEGRAPQSLGSQLSQDYIIEQLKMAGISPLTTGFKQAFTFNYRGRVIEGVNIVGKYIGKPSKDKRWLILSAHYDHKGTTSDGVFLGADDNASGTSAILLFAKKIKELNLSANFLFLLTDAEEMGLKGSRSFIEEFPQIVQQTSINVNIDMIGGSINTNKLFMLSKGLNRVLSKENIELLNQVDRDIGERVYTRFRNTIAGDNQSIKWLKASDHGPFYQADIPILFFCSGIHENYHTTKDSFQNINKPFYVNNTKIIFEHILFLADVINKS